MKTYFIVLFQGRSGSTWLIEALNTHPTIIARGEVLVNLKSNGFDGQKKWVRQYFGSDRPRARAVGFKTKLVDILDPSSMAEEFRMVDCHVIHLDRRNVVKQAISWIRADALYARTNDHNLRKDIDRLPPITIDPEDLFLRLQALEIGRANLQSFVQKLDLQVLTVEYEEFLLNPQSHFRRVQHFLNVNYHDLRSFSIKSTSDDLRVDINNFDELSLRFAGTPYLSMLEERSCKAL